MSDGLIIKFLDPSYLMMLIEDGEIAGSLVLLNEEGDDETFDGVISLWRNDNDDPMVNVSPVLEPGRILIRTFLENVKRITVL